MTRAATALQLHDVGAVYGRSVAVSGFTTPRFAGGDVVALLGPNGSGKSTLLKRIAGIVSGPGSVELVGADTSEIAYMPQDSASGSALTVYESVLVATRQGEGWRLADAELERVDAIIRRLGVQSFAFRELGVLSGGQRQLVSLAQTLARRPRILLLDEPTSALDLNRQLEILRFIRSLASEEGAIVLLSLHDINHALRFADHAMLFENGRLHDCGSCAALLSPETMRAVFKVEARFETCSKGRRTMIVDAALPG